MTTPIFNGVLPNNLIGYSAYTPTLIGTTSSGSVSYSTQVGVYQQVGALVYCSFVLIGSITGSPSGSLGVTLPISAIFPGSVNYSGICSFFSFSTFTTAKLLIQSTNSTFTFFTNNASIIGITTGSFNLSGTIYYLV